MYVLNVANDFSYARSCTKFLNPRPRQLVRPSVSLNHYVSDAWRVRILYEATS